MPFMTSTPVLYFDRNQFRSAGVDPDALPSDMGSLMEQVEQVIDAGVVKRGFVTASTEWFVSIWAADLGLELAPLSGRTALGPTTFDLSDNQLIGRLDRLRSFAEDGVVEHVPGDDFNDLLLLTDPTAPAAMVAHSSGSMKTVYDTLEVAFPNSELGVLPFPDSSNGTILGGPNAWLLADTEQQQTLGWAFISYLAGPAAQATVGSVGYAPIRRSALDDPALLASWAERPGLRVSADVLWSIDPSPASIGWAAGPDLAINWRLAWAGRDIIDGRPAIDSLADAQTDIVSALTAYRESRRQADAP
jgi:sn-glycerol 3-phosphate transport system substrate-binding protein